MSQTGYTPILLYGSSTASNVPLAANLTTSASGVELAINAADGKLFYKDSSGTVQVIASKAGNINVSSLSFGATGLTPNTATTGAITVAGTLATTNGGTGLTSFTANGVVYASSTSVLTTGSALVFDGTNLGVGTSSPTSKLDVNGNITVRNGSGVALGYVQNNSGWFDFSGSSNTNGVQLSTDSALPIRFVTNNTERMRLDSSGNLGLGVTPSAWTAYKAFQIGQASALFGDAGGNETILSSNTYYNSNFKYITTQAATYYRQINGSHAWFNAASGTAGNVISFAQAMTLDASGQLGIGTTSPSTYGLIVAKKDQTADTAITVSNQGTSNAATSMSFTLNEAGTPQGWLRRYRDGTANTEIGFSDALLFTGGVTGTKAERARIDSSGNLLVGQNTSGFSATNGVVVQPTQILVSHINGTGSGAAYQQFGYNGGAIGSITQNGTTGVLYNLTSDYRLKNNPEALTGAKDFVMALQPKKWQWWDGSGEGVGFVAHEFMEVAKYSGQGEKDAVDAEGKPMYQSIQPSSSEVMAYLVAHIQNLETRLAALESN